MKLIIGLLIALAITEKTLLAAEAGMPQLDPEYWASQGFWLIIIFSILYISISKFFLPKIKKNLEDREIKIKEDLETAKISKENAEKKLLEYENSINDSKKEVLKNLSDAKKKLSKEISMKKQVVENEIENETRKTQDEIIEFQKNSIASMNKIAEDIAANIIKDITGENLNENSIKAAVDETSKNNIGRSV
jgi:F-type H+-transporting ATPase subunit b|tara:strand:- start:513 stop:1088 length:576 start_codon:yes stop_codon:yes gene_type:complete